MDDSDESDEDVETKDFDVEFHDDQNHEPLQRAEFAFVKAPKNFFERFGDFLDSDPCKEKTVILVLLFFSLAVVMSYLYHSEMQKREQHLQAVASIRQFALDYDPSLQGKTDLEILAAVHLLTLHLLNWTRKNEELQNELKILITMLPGWKAFRKNLYYFSTIRKPWPEARTDCLARHTADLVSCKYGEEQGFMDEMASRNKNDYWIGLHKNESVDGGLVWINGMVPKETFWAKRQPNRGTDESCVAIIPPCNIKACWNDAPCSGPRFFCCKMAPKRRWMLN